MEKMISELATIEANSIDIIEGAKRESIQMVKDYEKLTEEYNQESEQRKDKEIMKIQNKLQEETDMKLAQLLKSQEKGLRALKHYYEDNMPDRVEEIIKEMLG